MKFGSLMIHTFNTLSSNNRDDSSSIPACVLLVREVIVIITPSQVISVIIRELQQVLVTDVAGFFGNGGVYQRHSCWDRFKGPLPLLSCTLLRSTAEPHLHATWITCVPFCLSLPYFAIFEKNMKTTEVEVSREVWNRVHLHNAATETNG